MHPDTAAQLGVVSGSTVLIETQHGSTRRSALPDPAVHPGFLEITENEVTELCAGRITAAKQGKSDVRNGDRSRPLHRMWRLYDGLRRGEQRPARAAGDDCPHRYHLAAGVSRRTTGRPFPDNRTVFFPIMCQQCGNHTPCASVCPQNAVETDPETGIVDQMPQRCLGCRYCMAACPYHARYFNWWDPEWPAGMEKTLNPDVSPRMRGVVEKCNFCHGRYHAAKTESSGRGQARDRSRPITFRLVWKRAPRRPSSSATDDRQGASPNRMLSSCWPSWTQNPKVYFRSQREWVRELSGERSRPCITALDRAMDPSRIERALFRRDSSAGSLPWVVLLAFGVYAAAAVSFTASTRPTWTTASRSGCGSSSISP